MIVSKMIRIFFIFLTVTQLTACNDNKLLYNLTQQQANQVLAILQQHNISAQKNGTQKTGYAITVDDSENTAALSIINQYQLPWAADVQISQAFPEGSIVASPNAEQARVLSLQEQRLEQSLRIISQVVNARVHVSYPPMSTDTGDKKPTSHVSVLISYKGEVDESLYIPQIKSLVKNSFDDVRYENISVALFPAPVIQYATPTPPPKYVPGTWTILLAFIFICVITTGGYLLYKANLRPPVRLKTTQDDNNEELRKQ